MDLAAKGLVTLVPRAGTVVKDYRTEGSLSLLTSLVNYHQGEVEPGLLGSLLEMRLLFETETARLAASQRTDDQLEAFFRLIKEETSIHYRNAEGISELDFEFHHLMALASGNLVYRLLLNSFKQCYLNLASRFFSDPGVVPEVFGFHKDMVNALEDKGEDKAVSVMRAMLTHGAEHSRRNRRRLKTDS